MLLLIAKTVLGLYKSPNLDVSPPYPRLPTIAS